MGGWRKLHNKELCDLYSLPSINWNGEIKEDEVSGACSANGGKRNAYRLLVGKPEGKNHKEDQVIGGWITLRWIL
jgi:hypothetical protein